MVTIEDLNPDASTMSALSEDPDLLSIDEAGSLLETLSSDNRRAVMLEVSKKPATTAELADNVGTSVQNTAYHLQKLQQAGLITVVGTHYSQKGLEMDVFGPTTPAIIIDLDHEPVNESDETSKRAVPAR